MGLNIPDCPKLDAVAQKRQAVYMKMEGMNSLFLTKTNHS